MNELLADALRGLIKAVELSDMMGIHGSRGCRLQEAKFALASYEDNDELTEAKAEKMGFVPHHEDAGTWWLKYPIDSGGGREAWLDLKRDIKKCAIRYQTPEGLAGGVEIGVPRTVGSMRRLIDALRALRGAA